MRTDAKQKSGVVWGKEGSDLLGSSVGRQRQYRPHWVVWGVSQIRNLQVSGRKTHTRSMIYFIRILQSVNLTLIPRNAHDSLVDVCWYSVSEWKGKDKARVCSTRGKAPGQHFHSIPWQAPCLIKDGDVLGQSRMTEKMQRPQAANGKQKESRGCNPKKRNPYRDLLGTFKTKDTDNLLLMSYYRSGTLSLFFKPSPPCYKSGFRIVVVQKRRLRVRENRTLPAHKPFSL